MIQIASLSDAADLALASYASLRNGATDQPDQRSALTDADMSETQARSFVRRFGEVVAQFNDSATGFSATVFRNASGMCLSIRGTETTGPSSDIFPTDFDIATSGAAYDQIVAMINWWHRASASTERTVPQYRFASYAPTGVPTGAVVVRENAAQSFVLEFAGEIRGAGGALFDALTNVSGSKIDVIGHSLGGHLAMAFSSIFPEVTERTIVFNAPGFKNTEVNQNFFELLGGSVPSTSSSIPIYNVIADEALVGSRPFNAAAGLHSRPGEHIDIAIENQWNSNEPMPFGALNHSSVPLVDSLAVYKLLVDLSPGLTPSDYKTILNDSAQGTAGGYEKVVDALESLFGVDRNALPTGNDKREDLYQAINRLAGPGTQYSHAIGQLEIRPSPRNAVDFLEGVQDLTEGLAYRYALAELSSLVVLDPQGIGLYSRYQTGGTNAGELDLYDFATNPSGLTQPYLQYRAEFLERKQYISGLDLNKHYEDTRVFPAAAPDDQGRTYQSQTRHYEDRASGFVASTGGNRNSLQHFVFGHSQTDVLTGAGRDDHLFGGAGADILIGAFDNDYLEGGTGVDTYVFKATDGADTVVDDRGVIVRDGVTIVLGFKQADTRWTFGGTTYTQDANGQDLHVSFANSATDKVTLRNFDFAAAAAGGYLGIRLFQNPVVVQGPARTFIGDRQNHDADPNTPGIQTQTDLFGNLVRADGQGDPARPDIEEANRADTFFGSAGNESERFRTTGGDDVVLGDGLQSSNGASGGRDFIETGSGRDLVIAGAGDDWIEGGAGADVLTGNLGNDAIYADSTSSQTLTLEQLIVAGEAGAPDGSQGDLLSGDVGDDIAIGAAMADYLAGGQGADLLVGGAGDDILIGDEAITSATMAWAVSRSVSSIGGVKNFRIDTTGLTVDAVPALGSADVLLGGAGKDWMFGGAGDDYLEGGNTVANANVEDDVLLGEAGNDVLVGGSGKDFLSGDSTSIDAAGLSGDDYLDGGAGDDELIGGKGNDALFGGAGNDSLVAGDGDDILVGGAGVDVLSGGAGKDTYVFNRGDGVEVIEETASGFGSSNPEASVVVFGEGITRQNVTFRLGSLMIDLGEGDALHFEGFSQDEPLSRPLIERLEFADGGVMTYQEMMDQGFDLEGTDGNDTIEGTGVADRIDAGAGDDVISARRGDDVIHAGTGADIVRPGFGNDTVYTGGGADLVQDDGGDDAVYAQGGETLIDDDGVNTLDLTAYEGLTAENLQVTQYQAQDGVLYLNLHIRDASNPGMTPEAGGVSIQRGELGYFSTVTVSDGEGGAVSLSHEDLMADHTPAALTYRGRDAAETLIGTPHADVMTGGAGADVLAGGDGVDRYRLSHINGKDTVVEASGAVSVIELAPGMLFTDLAARRAGDDLEIGIGFLGTSGTITVEDYYTRSQQITVLDTLSGASVSAETLVDVTEGRTLDREALKEEFRTTARMIFFDARARAGYSAVDAQTATRVDLTPATRSIVTTAETITTTFDWFDGRPDSVTQTNHSLVSWTDPVAGSVTTRTARFDASVQHSNSSFIFGVSGDSSSTTSAQAWAQMAWTRGHDQPFGPVHQQTTINIIEGTEIDPDTGEPIPEGLVITETRRVTLSGVATGRIVNLLPGEPPPPFNPDQLLPPYRLVTTQAQVTTSRPGEVQAGAGNNTITRGYIVDAGAGNDTISLASGLLLGGEGDDSISGTGELYGEGGDDVLRYDRAVQASPYLGQGRGNLVDGGSGNDRLHGGGVVLRPGSGNDLLLGGFDPDVARIGAADIGVKVLWDTGTAVENGDGGLEGVGDDRIELPGGATLATLAVSRGILDPAQEGIAELESDRETLELWWGSGTLLRIVLRGDESGELYEGFEVVRLGDGTELSVDQLATLVGVLPEVPVRPLSGTPFADTLTGTSASEFITGFEGDDHLAGGDGDDRYFYREGDGFDEVSDSGGSDTLLFGTGIDIADVVVFSAAGNVRLAIDGLEAGVVLMDWFADEGRIEQVEFADGTTWDAAALESRIVFQAPLIGTNDHDFIEGSMADEFLQGLEGDDELVGGGGADIFRGGPGSDFSGGGEGDDIYLYFPGDQIEGIFDAGGFDTVRFGPGMAPGDIVVTRNPYESLYLVVAGTGDRVTLHDWFIPESRIEQVEFADGTLWSAADLESRIATAPATEFDDILNGSSGDDAIDALEGDDRVYGNAGNDILRGGPGDDELQDWEGSSLIEGGAGNDYVFVSSNAVVAGGTGDDWIDGYTPGVVLAFNPGDGNDTVSAGSALTLSLGGGIGAADLVLSEDGGELLVSIGSADSIRLQRAYDENGELLPLPELTLQLFGSVHTFDMSAVIEEFHAARAADPSLETFALDGVLQLHQTDFSEDAALGGALAWRYATTGSLESLSNSQVRDVLGDEGFGVAAQLIEPASGNAAPAVANAIEAQHASEDSAYSFQFAADVFSDPGDTLDYAADELPAWLSFDSATRTFSGTPLQADVGTTQVSLIATDTGGLSAEHAFTLTVANVNDTPVVADPIEHRSFAAGSPFVFAVAASFEDPDAGDALTYSASLFGGAGLPAWLEFDPATATFAGNPATANIGVLHLQVTATDAAGASAGTDFGLFIHALDDSTVTGTKRDDVLLGGDGDETLIAKGGNDALFGGDGDDLLRGGGGQDVLQGGEGNDTVRAGAGHNLLDGGAGDDLLYGGGSSSLLVGGTGNDLLRTGHGNDLIAFNRGDGADTVIGDRDGDNVLSLGGGIRYADLTFSKDGKDLVVGTGGDDRVVLKGWYNGKHSVLNLQVVLDATEDFDAGSTDPLYNRKVQAFDFAGLVGAFDQARTATPGLTSWAVTNALLQFHLSGADDSALGGDLAYWYGRNGSLGGISVAAAQEVIGAPGFGAEAQSLRPFSGLQEGFVKLA